MAYKMFDVEKLIAGIKKKQETINRNSRKMKTAPKSITIGWTKASGKYPEQNGKPVSYIATIHEYGLGNQTEKAMVSNTIFLHKKEWASLYRKLLAKELRRKAVADYYMIAEKIGEQMKLDLKNYIREIDLIETSRLMNSIIVTYSRR